MELDIRGVDSVNFRFQLSKRPLLDDYTWVTVDKQKRRPASASLPAHLPTNWRK